MCISFSAIVLSSILLFALITDVVKAQNLPEISCPQYFQYTQCGSEICAKLTLPPYTTNSLSTRVDFSMPIYVQLDNWGSLETAENQNTAGRHMQSGIPVVYNIRFPVPNVVPKLVRLTVNGMTIVECNGIRYSTSETSVTNFHLISTLRGTGSVILPTTTNYDFKPNFRPTTTFTEASQPMPFDGGLDTLVQQTLGDTVYRFDEFDQDCCRTQQRRPVPRPTAAAPITPAIFAPNNPPAVRPRQEQPVRANSIDYSECGVEGTKGGFVPFVHQGVLITKGQFPWLATIYKIERTGLNFTCGGSLISRRSVLTAAHCFKINQVTAKQMLVYLGRHDLSNYEDAKMFEIESLLAHEEFSTISLPDADIALIQLRTAVEYTAYIRPICLWTESVEFSIIEGLIGTIAGWGADEKGNLVSTLPKMADTTIVSNDTCTKSNDIYKGLLSARSFCAGELDGSGPCKGDSGSGLMIKRNNRWTIRGIVSAGYYAQQQCDLKHYVTYCDVAQHNAWVRRNMLT